MPVPPTRLKFLGPVAVGVVFVFAAFAKTSPSSEIATVFRHFGVPDSLVVYVAFVLVSFEAALGASLIVFPGRRQILWLGVTTLAVFCGVLIMLALDNHAPSCHCLGAWRIFESRRQELLFSLARNGLLVASLIPAIGRESSTTTSPKDEMHQ